jgi:hypothetical protein
MSACCGETPTLLNVSAPAIEPVIGHINDEHGLGRY